MGSQGQKYLMMKLSLAQAFSSPWSYPDAMLLGIIGEVIGEFSMEVFAQRTIVESSAQQEVANALVNLA